MRDSNYLDNYKEAYQENFAFELDNRLLLNWYPERILEFARGDSLLELGLGHGYTTLKFADKFERHLVLDGSPEVIRQFRDKYGMEEVTVQQTFFEEYETDERFDVIVMGFILEHVEDPGLILKHYQKFLTPDGSIFVAVPNAEALHRRLGYEAGLIQDMSILGEADLALGHRRLFTVQSLSELVQQKGYIIERTEGVFLKPLTTGQLTTLNLPEEVHQAMLKVGVQYPELCVGILMELKTDR